MSDLDRLIDCLELGRETGKAAYWYEALAAMRRLEAKRRAAG
jgi:hypothetical protein